MNTAFSLLVDDAAPVNCMHWESGHDEHDILIPATLAAEFGGLCADYGVRGKFSVLPMPVGLGRIDQKLSYVPQRELRAFLSAVKKKIAPRFDITPEILTHFRAYRIKDGGFMHLAEDDWAARATVEEMTDYISLALEILRDVGLEANGVTSPWMTGINNEKAYAEAIGAAQWRVHGRKVTWYFLHMLCAGEARWPWVTFSGSGRKVVAVPCTTDDVFWRTQNVSLRAGRKVAAAGVDGLISADGKTGRVRCLLDHGWPVLPVTHWQSVWSDGTRAGLWGLERLFKRLRSLWGDEIPWVTCSELAQRAAAGS